MGKKIRRRIFMGLLLALHLPILFAGFIAPYNPAAQNREFPYAPPVLIHFVDDRGIHLRPFFYAQVATDDGYRYDISTPHSIRFFVKGDEYEVFGVFKSGLHLFGIEDTARIFLMGTDSFGRDEFSRLLYGGQISLAAGLLATFITLLVAAVMGTVSGYYGKWIDEALMGSAELFLSLPWLYFLLVVRSLLPLHVSPTTTFMLLIAVIAVIGWARPARLIRGIVLSARSREYVVAARGFGASDFYLLRRHVLPQAVGVLLTQAALLVPQYVAAEVTLSFFGLGVSEPTPSWGNMLSVLQQYRVLMSYNWLLAPAVALVITSVTYWVLADTIRYWIQSP
jgi:peptide/nickel transport system permease protein